MPISSRPELSTCTKVSGNRTNYAPEQMTDASVYEKARHYYTVEEIAESFKVSAETVLHHHGDAFRLGKEQAKMKPRLLHGHMMDQMMGLDYTDPKIAGTQGYLAAKLIEMQWKKQEGYGQKTIVEHTGNVKYDSVESQPLIIEKPADE